MAPLQPLRLGDFVRKEVGRVNTVPLGALSLVHASLTHTNIKSIHSDNVWTPAVAFFLRAEKSKYCAPSRFYTRPRRMTTDFHRSDVRAVCSLFRLTAHGHTLKSKYRYDAAAAATPRILPQVFVVIAFFSLSLFSTSKL